MTITINYPLDELQLSSLIAAGWTTLKLYYSDSPEGPFTDSGATPSPATLALVRTALAPFHVDFPFATGNGAMYYKVLAYDGVSVSDINDAQTFHGGGGTTLRAIRQRVGKLIHAMHIGTTTSAGAANGSTAIANVAKFTRFRDTYFGGGAGVDGWFYNNLATNEWTVVSNWVQSSGTFTFSPAFAAQVGNASLFEVMARWTPDEYRDAINWAIVNCYPILSKPVVDTGTITQEDIFSYPIPNSIRILNSIEIEAGDNLANTDNRTRGMPWRRIPYALIDDGLNRSVEFKRELQESRRLRFTGTTMLNGLYNDTDYIEVIDPQVDLIVYLAAHRLYALLSNTDAASDIDRYQQQASYYLSLFEQYKKTRATRRKAKMNWAHDARWSY
jgi:hypothetical protein